MRTAPAAPTGSDPDLAAVSMTAGRPPADGGPARENFPVALRVLPREIRRHLFALYRFARGVDDIGDEPVPGLSQAGRLAALDAVEQDIHRMYAGRTPHHPLVAPLRHSVLACGLPAEPLLRLVAANRQDQAVAEYLTFGQLRDYCHLSADPVGELVLHIFGVATPARIRLSDQVCTALQLAEHLQDVGQDARRGRIYLPRVDRDRFAVPVTALTARRAGPELRRLVALEAARAGSLLESGAPLVLGLTGWARLSVSGYLAGGRAALAALARAGYDPLSGSTRPTSTDMLGQWMRARLRGTG